MRGKHHPCFNMEPVLSAVIRIQLAERMMRRVYGHIRRVPFIPDTIQFGIHSNFAWTTVWGLCFVYYFFEVAQISQQSHSQSGFHEVKVVQEHIWIQCRIGSFIIAMGKENVTSLVQCKLASHISQILRKLLPSPELSLPGGQVISGLGIESRLFGHNWNAGHNYSPLLTYCDIVPDCGTISQLHKHTLVYFCYYHSLPKTQMSVLITDRCYAEPGYVMSITLALWGPYPCNSC